MPRRRTDTNVLRLRGAVRKNPARYVDRQQEPVPQRPLGLPLNGMTVAEITAWNDVVDACEPGVLWRRDRLVVETAARILAMVRTDGIKNVSPALVSRLEALLSKMGLTPSDASRVRAVLPVEPNEFDDFRPAR